MWVRRSISEEAFGVWQRMGLMGTPRLLEPLRDEYLWIPEKVKNTENHFLAKEHSAGLQTRPMGLECVLTFILKPPQCR